MPVCRPSSTSSASSNIASAELSFPAPQRFDDGFADLGGLQGSGSFPVGLHARRRRRSPRRSRPMCSSASAKRSASRCRRRSSLDPASDPDNADDAALVKAALDALPGPEQPDFGVTALPSGGKDEVLVEAAFAGRARRRSSSSWRAATATMFGPPRAARRRREADCSPCRSSSGRNSGPPRARCTTRWSTGAGAVSRAPCPIPRN